MANESQGTPPGLLVADGPDLDVDSKLRLEVDRRKKLAKEGMDWHNSLKANRQTWERVWQEVRELIRPNASDFSKRTPKAQNRKERVFDDYPGIALQVMAAGLHSSLTNPATRWFGLSTRDIKLDQDEAAAIYLEGCANAIFDELSSPSTGFNTASHEFYAEVGAFGTAVIHLIDGDEEDLCIRPIPLAECFISENEKGIVDVLSREFELTLRQAKMQFGDMLPRKVTTTAETEKPQKFVHLVYPVSDGPLKFKSLYIHIESGELVGEGAFREFPYCVVRWTKMAGDVYGRSPGMDCLQNVRVLNEMTRILLQASQLQAAPPIIYENDGVLAKVVLEPWKNLMIAPGSRPPEPLKLNPSIPITENMIKYLREIIGKNFFNDLFASPDYGNRDRVTAEEVINNRDERLRQLSPVLARLEVEFLNSLIQRVFAYLERKKRLPAKPSSMQGKNLFVEYMSPAARALRSTKGQNNLRFLQTMIPFLNFKPDLLDPIDIDFVVKDLGFGFDISRMAVKTDAQVTAIRKARSDAAQAAQAAPSALVGSQAIKNIAQAHQASPGLANLLPQ